MEQRYVDVSQKIIDNGYAVIKNILDPWELAALKNQIGSHLSKVQPDSENKFMGSKTKRFGRLLYRIPYSKKLATHPLSLKVCDEFLLPYCERYQIHFTGVMHVESGEKAQVLHRDIVPFTNPSPPMTIAMMWAISDFTRENGATVLVPGSHKWDYERKPTREELVCEEMPSGSVLIYAGNLIHGAGANVSEDSRTGLNIQYTLGWLRQEENQYLAVPREVARTFDIELQRLMGYEMARRHWGYVDQEHPLDFLNQRTEVGTISPGYLDDHKTSSFRCEIDYRDTNSRYEVTLDDPDESLDFSSNQ